MKTTALLLGALGLGWTGVGLVAAPVATRISGLEAESAPPLVSAAELALLDRENAMWRLADVEVDPAGVIATWRAAGFSAEEIARAEPILTVIWEVPLRRQFGWLSRETAEKIKAVDAAFVAQMRAARLRLVRGVIVEKFPVAMPLQVSAQWRRAVLQVLDHREIGEFNLMNSGFARRVEDWAGDVPLSDDERRTLIEWEREFALVHQSPEAWAGGSPSARAWRERAREDLHDRMRALLGDERAATYLAGSNRAFGRMCEALDDLALDAHGLLELWALRRDYQRKAPQVYGSAEKKALAAATQARVEALLGPELYQVYTKHPESRWLFPRVIQRRTPKTRAGSSETQAPPPPVSR